MNDELCAEHMQKIALEKVRETAVPYVEQIRAAALDGKFRVLLKFPNTETEDAVSAFLCRSGYTCYPYEDDSLSVLW